MFKNDLQKILEKARDNGECPEDVANNLLNYGVVLCKYAYVGNHDYKWYINQHIEFIYDKIDNKDR